jgi:hypothetical protein
MLTPRTKNKKGGNMSVTRVYQKVRKIIQNHMAKEVDESSLVRLCLLVMGIITSKSASPSQIAKAIAKLGLTAAKAESIERRIRRTENDPEINPDLCFHPLASWRLRFGRPRRLHLIMDVTTQEDHVVKLMVSIWYRGRSLPLAWSLWPANISLPDFNFWDQVSELLDEVATLLPAAVPIIWLADRAFGCPAFTDLIETREWHYVVRVQGHTRYQDPTGRVWALAEMTPLPGDRAKSRGQVFKKRGWRIASVVIHWGHRHKTPLCLVSDLSPDWLLLAWYRRRYAIEATFRDYKSHGWHWEQSQVRDLDHIDRLLVGMALASWIVLMVGTQVAQEYLLHAPAGKRRTLPWIGKFSLFSLGLDRLHALLFDNDDDDFHWFLTDWNAPNWSIQVRSYHVRAFIFA